MNTKEDLTPIFNRFCEHFIQFFSPIAERFEAQKTIILDVHISKAWPYY